jgi:hypothetical protein
VCNLIKSSNDEAVLVGGGCNTVNGAYSGILGGRSNCITTTSN